MNALTLSSSRKMLKTLPLLLLVIGLTALSVFGVPTMGWAGPLDKTGAQWAPYLEWTIQNSSFSGNPYDLVGTATFVHSGSGETHTTEMFYDGGDMWKFRFTGTRLGAWTVTTSSSDSNLHGLTGNITVNPNSNPNILGFVTHSGQTWAKQVDGTGTIKAFVPQLVMVNGPQGYYNNPSAVDNEINRFLGDHGFNGFHILVTCRWAEMEEQKCTKVDDPNPDTRTFEALELVISKVHAAGGIVHLWAWGDESRNWTPKTWGLNGTEDKRLQRYIAARLGPLPGWTMGYGFDNWEWASESDVSEWYSYMQAHLGWPHFLGARASKNTLDQIYEGLDYSGYEQHRPDYDKYVETIEKRPGKPSFSEDRFRIRNSHPDKDYTYEMVRRGGWHSTMAGGVANIWGDLTGDDGANDGTATSASFPNPEWIKTNALFFKDRFHQNLVRCHSLTDGVCLQQPNNQTFLFYKENTSSISLNLSGMDGAQSAVAVDTKLSYQEMNLGTLSASNQTWQAPYSSDWAIAIGIQNVDTDPPSPPTGVSVH